MLLAGAQLSDWCWPWSKTIGVGKNHSFFPCDSSASRRILPRDLVFRGIEAMGLWNFVKNAGKKLVGSAEAAEAPPEDTLRAEIDELGLDASGLDISVEGDTVKVSGEAVSQEMKEKVILAVGNVEGVASVDDAAGGADPVFHTVEKGDTLWGIAAKTMGNGAKYEEIFEANRPMLSHPDKIYPGQVLRIPT